ncbi:MAG: hypothetical protein KGK03_10860 [Candidatus Omnitrophica bacterium]|nr:hypothetical protein [Candidatus Omnitrophota bacterium]
MKITSIWDLGRALLSVVMAFTGLALLGMLFFNLLGLNKDPLPEKILAGLPFLVAAVFLAAGMYFVFGRLRKKCKSEWDFWMIMLSFSLAGMFIMPVRKLIFHLLGIGDHTPFWIKVIVYIPIIPPTYYVGLIFFGTLLGQSQFFKEMIGKRIAFLTGRKNVKHKIN